MQDQGGEKLPRNTVLFRPDSPRSLMGDTPQIVEVPERDRRGYRYHLLYLGTGPDGGFRGIRLIGSKDGIHWDTASDTRLAAIGSDHHNTVAYDPQRDEYVMFLRSKHIYLAPGQKGATGEIELGPGGERLNTGQSRRGVSRMSSKELWTE
ncbi:MAG: hypothetical protein HY000_32530, partial [Planctomycetes bacterium]|nr:hypothetical protein [Planctomycetota bacterium]